MEKLNESWMSLFDDVILERGFTYYRNNRILSISEDNGNYNAIVRGTNSYNVFIQIINGVVEELHCSCPYAETGKNCKHEAAVLYQIEEPLQEKKEYESQYDEYTYQDLSKSKPSSSYFGCCYLDADDVPLSIEIESFSEDAYYASFEAAWMQEFKYERKIWIYEPDLKYLTVKLDELLKGDITEELTIEFVEELTFILFPKSENDDESIMIIFNLFPTENEIRLKIHKNEVYKLLLYLKYVTLGEDL